MTPAIHLARLRWRATHLWLRFRKRSRTRDMASLRHVYERIWRDAANTLSATMTEVGEGFWRIERGTQSTLVNNYVVQIDDPVTLNLAGDKALCHEFLAAARLPVPEHAEYTLDSLAAAMAFMRRHPGCLFVVKPVAGTSGARGVTTHVTGPIECRRASVVASLYGERILIERWIPGESYRLLFLDGEFIHASRRRGCRVTGNGRDTVEALIATQTRIGLKHAARRVCDEVVATLRAQQLSLGSVPEAGRSILVLSTAEPAPTMETRTVFDEQATADIGTELRDQAARAVSAIGSNFAGVDIITIDPAVALESAGGAINEINTTPGLHHHYGLRGQERGAPPAVRVLARLLEAPLPSDHSPAPVGAALVRGR